MTYAQEKIKRQKQMIGRLQRQNRRMDIKIRLFEKYLNEECELNQGKTKLNDSLDILKTKFDELFHREV